MKAIVCEMCNSRDLIKQDGLYVCQSCGTKYTVEEAKKLFVNVENLGSAQNYEVLAKSAYDSGNYQESESYATKIIEIDPSNAIAWLIKGASAAWQSSVANMRMEEFLSSVEQACNASNTIEELEENAKWAYTTCYSLCLALNKLVVDYVKEYPDQALIHINKKMQIISWGTIGVQPYYGKRFTELESEKPEEARKKPKDLSIETGYTDLILKCDKQLLEGASSAFDSFFTIFKMSNNGRPIWDSLVEFAKKTIILSVWIGGLIPKEPKEESKEKVEVIIRACKKKIDMLETLIKARYYTFSAYYNNWIVAGSFTNEKIKEWESEIRETVRILSYYDPAYQNAKYKYISKEKQLELNRFSPLISKAMTRMILGGVFLNIGLISAFLYFFSNDFFVIFGISFLPLIFAIAFFGVGIPFFITGLVRLNNLIKERRKVLNK